MPFRRASATLLLLCLAAFGLASCLARRRVITRAGAKSTQALLVADKESLIESVARQYHAIHDLTATVDMVPALGSAEKSRITEYKDVRAFILFRQSADIRIIGLMPVVRTKAFDMVSDGSSFKLYVPSRNRFIVGRNELTTPSQNKLENLRPQHFQEALLVKPVEPSDKALLENLTDEDTAAYILHLVREETPGSLRIARTIWFNRLNLRMARQIIFDDRGNILTDARYSDWQVYDGVPFPKHVEVNRPRDEYAVVLTVVKMDINKGLNDEKFRLDQPEGATLQKVGEAGVAPSPAAEKKTAGKERIRKK